MKILAIGLDKNIAKSGSPESSRQEEYSRLFDETHILVLASGQDKKIGEKLWIYFSSGSNKILKFFSAVKKGGLIIKNRRIGVITAQDPFFAGLIGFWLKRKFGVKLHIQIHTDFLNPYFGRESFLNGIRIKLAKFLLPRADGIRVVSERIADSIKSSRIKLKAEPVVLPVFVDVEGIKSSLVRTNLRYKYPQFDFIILAASRLTKEKNLLLAIRAMARVLKAKPKIGMIIAGNGPEREFLLKKIKSMELERNIILEPWAGDLVSYLKTADLFLISSNYEGYGRTIVEAVAAGCRVISSDAGISREFLDRASIFSVGDENDLRDKILGAIGGNLAPAKSLAPTTKEQYLINYKRALENCL
ncbi:MAG: Glycosyltransferase [Parcubacteria group bacterium GW2011_GWA1_42_7]|nr:MAG: Glycosyltransferase [Parcubacteria group bacterium GW2011_GWB1_42_6]KKS69992.1 MAG: Glycosyltransferase [Parcubacteria group bacterium GW2011_GWA1_42_7]KKS91850.1 MAG: Glycosyltransferase [Parcubacteria group bacterium GW2011_GWC1_43_12]